MLEFIRSHQRLMFIVLLVLIAPPFFLFGLQGYTSMREGGSGIASVAGVPISEADFNQAQRDQLQMLRQRYGASFDAKMLDDPKQRAQTLDTLIAQRVLQAEIVQSKMTVSNRLVAQKLAEDPSVKALYGPDGTLDAARYDQLLASIGKSREGVFQDVRQALLMREVGGTIPTSTLVPTAVVARLDTLLGQAREVADVTFHPADFKSAVKLAPDAVEKYYAANPTHFQIPEQVDIQYLVLDQKSLADGLTIAPAVVQAYYEAHQKQYQTPEERRASHILIAVAKSATAEQREKAKTKAQELLARARAHPGDFAKLARENSEDPGSAARGGDLDWAPATNYVAPFATALSALKENAISDVVETEFGYHIILLTGIRPAKQKPFDDVKGEIEAQLRTQRAKELFAQSAEDFTNEVYTNASSLDSTAAKFGLKIQTAAGVPRVPVAGNRGPLANPKLLTDLFSDDVLKAKHNTEAVEIGPDALIAARVTSYRAAQTRPLAEVADAIRTTLLNDEATRLAKAAGEAKLAALRAHDDTSGFSPAKLIGRSNPQGVPPAALTEIFKADARTLPTFASAVLPDGSFSVYRISRVEQPKAPDMARVEGLKQELVRAQGELELDAYTESLRKKFKVSISLPPAADEATKTSTAP